MFIRKIHNLSSFVKVSFWSCRYSILYLSILWLGVCFLSVFVFHLLLAQFLILFLKIRYKALYISKIRHKIRKFVKRCSLPKVSKVYIEMNENANNLVKVRPYEESCKMGPNSVNK